MIVKFPKKGNRKRAKRKIRPQGTRLFSMFPVVLFASLVGIYVPKDGTIIGFLPARLGGTDAGTAVYFAQCHSGGGTNCVVDGDTFYLAGEKIRIADIDTPETHDAKCPAEQSLGDQATDRLQDLLNAGPVTLEPIWGRDTDVYGRLLRTVHSDGRSIGTILVEEGLARPYGDGRRPWC